MRWRFLTVWLSSLLLVASVFAQPQEAAMPRAKKTVIRVPWHIYRFYPPDFSQWQNAALGFKGWESEVRDLDLAKTCLVLMHLPDRGLTPDTEFSLDLGNPNMLGTVEDVPRTREIAYFRLPRVVAAARTAGLQVATIGVGESTMKGTPLGRQCTKEAGPPPPADDTVVPLDRKRWAAHDKDLYNLPLPTQPGYQPGPHVWGLPEVLRPQGTDLVACHSWQLARLLKKRGIDHLIYCGYAIDECLWFEPCGMCDMKRRGFLCSALRGGLVAIETKESCVGEKNLEYALWKTCSVFGYVFELHEFTSALRQHAAARAKH